MRLWNKNHFPRNICKVPFISVLSTESGRHHRSPQSSAIVLSTSKITAVKETLCNHKAIHPHCVVFKCYINSLTHQIQKFYKVPFLSCVLTTFKWRSYNCVSKFKVCKSVHHHTIQINQPTRCKNFSSLLLDVYLQLNVFRASTRPSSGAQQLQ